MKTFLLLRAAVVATATAAVAAEAAITIDPASRTFTKNGGGAAVLTQGTGSWTATTDAGWITLSRASGNAGESCVYTVAANMTADQRTGTISIAGNVHTVIQSGYAATLSPSTKSFDWQGGDVSVSIAVDAGVSWSAAANADWLSLSPDSGTSAGTVVVTAAPYGGVTTRTGSLTIAGQTFSVSQTGRDVVLSPDRVEKEDVADVFQVTVSALSSTRWTVIPNDTWISVVDAGSGRGSATVVLAVGQNPSYLKRTGTVSVGSATLTVVQGGYPAPILSITPETAEAAATGSYGNVAVYATPDAPWSAQSLASWITLTAGTPGAGNGNVKYVASANPGLSERTGRIKFTPPAVEPEVDYLAGLVVWCPNESGWDWASGRLRSTTNFNARFNGTFKNELAGIPSDCPAYGFAFQVEELQAIHRLAACGNQTIWIDADDYLVTSSGGRTSFRISKTDAFYQVLVNGTTVWAGERGAGELACVGTCTRLPTGGSIQFGRTEVPSSGYLSGAHVSGLAMWSRILTDGEAALLGTSLFPEEDEVFPGDEGSIPAGSPSGTGYAHFQFGGNCLFGTNDSSQTIDYSSSKPEFSLANTTPTTDRFGRFSRALQITDRSEISSDESSFAERFDDANGTFNMWVKFESLPSTGETNGLMSIVAKQPFDGGVLTTESGIYSGIYYKRDDSYPYTTWYYVWSDSVDGSFGRGYPPSIESTRIELTQGCFVWNGNPIPIVLDTEDWHMITIICHEDRFISLFIDGQESGSVSTEQYVSLKAETFAYKRSTSLANLGADHLYSLQAYETQFEKTISIGSWDGALDEMTIFHDALTSAQVKALYEAGKPNAVYHTVTQGAVAPSVAPSIVRFGAAGGSTNVSVTVAQNVNWTVSTDADWISLPAQTARIGSGTVSFDAAPNPGVAARNATVEIAGVSVPVEQAGLAAVVSCDDTTFGADGGFGYIEVNAEGNAEWTAESEATWIWIASGETGSGSGEAMFIVDPYADPRTSRTGVVRIADRNVYITQRGYELSISPEIAELGSNAGAGQFGVAAPIDAVWEALATEDWITITGGQTGLGNGTLHYTVADNDTGAIRTGRIIVAGQVYTITQLTAFKLETEVEGEGSVSGAGNYDVNETATLVATPAEGYAFSHWSGDAVGVEPSVSFTMDTSKRVTAHFVPAQVARAMLQRAAAEEGLYTADQMHELALGDSVIELDGTTGSFDVGVRLQRRPSLGQGDWTDVNATSGDVSVGADGRVRIRVAPEGNASFFRFVNKGE